MTARTPATDGQHFRRTGSRAALGAAALLLLIHLLSTHALWRGHRGQALSLQDARLLLDPNTATRAELMLLPQIGPTLSERIVSCRESVATPPAFSSADDLDQVRGIGRITIDRLRPHLRFERRTSDMPERDP